MGDDSAKGPFEPDPAKWPRAAIKAAKGITHMQVWFEWMYVHRVRDGKKVPHRVSMRVSHIVRVNKPKPLRPQFGNTGVFRFNGPQGRYELTGLELVERVKEAKLFGPAKHEAISRYIAMLRSSFLSDCDASVFGDTVEKHTVGRAFVEDAVKELEAIASMQLVDGFVICPEIVLDDIRETSPLMDPSLSDVLGDWLRKPLREFFEVCGRDGCVLFACYSALDEAADAFQQTWPSTPRAAVERLERETLAIQAKFEL